MFPQSTIQLRSDDTVTIVVVLLMVMVVDGDGVDGDLQQGSATLLQGLAFAQAGHRLLLRKPAANPGNF